MGSTGTGKFGDYQPDTSATRCDESIDAALEDVMLSEYVNLNGTLPSGGIDIRLRPNLLNDRLVAETLAGVSIGNLPTRYNYLVLCIHKGYEYTGTITSVRSAPVPSLDVHLDPV